MKLTFLGSSHGVPSAQRYCSSVMIEAGESVYLIDAGAPVVDLLLRYGKNIDNLKAVFTTHAHSDHTGGLIDLSTLCTWYFKKSFFEVFVTDRNIASAVDRWISATGSGGLAVDRIRYHVAGEGEVYRDENLRVTYIPTKHMEPSPSFAVLVESNGKSVLFSGDLSAKIGKNDFPRVALEQRTELTVCEMAHFGPEDIEPYMLKLKTQHLCFNHVYPVSRLDIIERISQSGVYPYKISIAYDGYEIEV